MRTVHKYSHLGGAEILQVRHPEVMADIRAVITAVAPTGLMMGAEATSHGQWSHPPVDVADQFAVEFHSRGFQTARDPNAAVDACGQIAFVKQKVYVEVQLSAQPFVFYDSAKFQHFYHNGQAEVAVKIGLAHARFQPVPRGVSGADQPLCDIERMKHCFPVVPISVLLVDV